MHIKILTTTVFFAFVLYTPVFSGEFTLKDMITALKKSSPYYQKSVLTLEGSQARYEAGKSGKKFSLNYTLPVTYGETKTGGGLDMTNTGRTLSTGPSFSFSKELPSAGSVSGTITNSLYNTDYDTSAPNEGWANTLSVSASLSQPVFFGSAGKAGDTKRGKTYENSTILFGKMVNSFLIQGIQDYYTLKQMKLNNELITSRLDFEEGEYKKAEKEFSLGIITKTQVYQVKAVYMRSQTDLLQAQQKYSSSLSFFKEIYGLDKDAEISSTVHSFPHIPFNREELLNTLQNTNPDIITLKNSLAIHNAEVTIAKKDHSPVFSLTGDLSFQTRLPADKTNTLNYSLTAAVAAPLLDGGKYREILKGMITDGKNLENDLVLKTMQVKNEASSLLDSLELTGKLMELNEIEIEAARYEVEKGKKDLEMGQITKRNFQTLERVQENALLAKQQNVINRNITYLQLLALKGEDISKRLPGKE